MRLLTFFIFAASLAAHADSFSQQVTLSGKDLPLKQVFAAIKKQTGYSVFFNQELLAQARPVSITADNMPLEQFLAAVLLDQPLSYKIEEKTIFISRKSTNVPVPSFAEKIAGLPPLRLLVTDMNGNPLSGASVTNKKTKKSVVTNAEGVVNLTVSAGDRFEVSYVGFTTESFIVKEGSSSVNIRMEPKSMLDEAVIYNGYQKIQQKVLTGAVTSLKMDSIMQPGFNTVDKMLEGRVPGLTFMQNSGQSGAAPKLRIRGTSTILGNREPLWVVDGIVRTNPVPIPASRINDPDFVNLLGNAISGLNPYDIDQVDVLKDATAAALYGVRAANGVIVVTTKRGRPGPPIMSYNATMKYTRRPRYTDNAIFMMNSRDRVDVSRELIGKKLTLRGGALEAYEKAIMSYYDGFIDYNTFKEEVGKAERMNTDWIGNTTQDVFATDHSLGISGGSPSASYRASVSYSTQPGVIRKERNDRYTGSVNLILSYRKFRAEFNVQMNKVKRRYTPQEIGILDYAYSTSRAIPLYNEDGSLYYYSPVGSSNQVDNFRNMKAMNIVNEMERTGQTTETGEYTTSANLNYEISEGIQLNSMLAYTGGNTDHQVWFEEQTQWVANLKSSSWDTQNQVFSATNNPIPLGGELRQKTVKKENYMVNVRIDFKKYLDRYKKHNLTAAIGAELASARDNTVDQVNRGYYPERGHSFAIIDLSKYPAYSKWLQDNGASTIMALQQNSVRTFLTATYMFKDRFVVTAATSQEYSNAFGSKSNEKFLPTWALSGRWNMEEDLFKNTLWIDRLALRFSYGIQGQMHASQTPYTVIQKGAMNNYYNSFVSNIISFPNPDLLWEKKHDYSGGFDFSLLKGKITGTLGFFYSKTVNAFLDKQVTSVNGVSSYVVNGGTVENYGSEISLNFLVINSMGSGRKKGFMWRFDPQLGQVFNKLINNSLRSNNIMVDPATVSYASYLSGSIPIDGKPVNTFYSYRFKTLDSKYGFPIFYGAEPENAAALTAAYNKMTRDEVFSMVLVESGRRDPVIQGGISNSFSYRNWSLNIMFAYSLGNKIRLLQIANGNYGTHRPSSQQNLRNEFVDRWRYPGDENKTNIPAIQGGDFVRDGARVAWWSLGTTVLNNPFAVDYYQMYDNSDLRVVKGDFLKLQSVNLAYNFPAELARQMRVKGASVILSGTDLFTIANKKLRGQDPAQSGSAPNINLSIRPTYACSIKLSF